MRRIVSNYIRLATTFAIGVVIIRLMAEIGQSALVLYLLLVAGTGLAQLFKIVLRESVIPVLGLTFDGKSGRSFDQVYRAAVVSSFFAGLFCLLCFAVIWAVSGNLDLGGLGALTVAVAIGSCGAQTFASAVATPFLNAVLIDHRIVSYNVFLILERLTELVAAVVALLLPPEYGLEERVIVFYALSGGLFLLLQVGIFVYATRCDARFRVSRGRLVRSDIRWIAGFLGWNLAVVAGFALYTRLTMFTVNWGLGEGATLGLGLVLALIGYQRQIAMGLVIGLDAAISRHYGKDTAGGRRDAEALTIRSTYIQAVFAAFSIALLWVFIEPILRLWLGHSLAASDWDVGQSVLLFKVMSIGIAARSISEGWMKFLSGKGEVRSFAPFILGGGAVFAVFVLVVVSRGTAWDVLLMIAIAYSAFHVIVHAGLIAFRTAGALGVRARTLFGLVALPFVLACALVGLHRLIYDTTLSSEAGLVALFLLGLGGIASLVATGPVIARLSGEPR